MHPSTFSFHCRQVAEAMRGPTRLTSCPAPSCSACLKRAAQAVAPGATLLLLRLCAVITLTRTHNRLNPDRADPVALARTILQGTPTSFGTALGGGAAPTIISMGKSCDGPHQQPHSLSAPVSKSSDAQTNNSSSFVVILQDSVPPALKEPAAVAKAPAVGAGTKVSRAAILASQLQSPAMQIS